MKKLNRKGFTLIELLAVIVVLAIVLVVTIPSVLSSMATARKKQFTNAVTTVEEYMKKQIEACSVGDKSLADYKDTVVESTTDSASGIVSCKIKTNASGVVLDTVVKTIVEEAGYTYGTDSTDFQSMTVTADGTVQTASSGGKSKFNAQSY